MYKKRPGTSGVKGQLYETKLLSLLNFRAQHDDDIEEFHLATNLDLIGEFDDIYLKAKVKGFAKQMAIFVQCKHRETDKVLSLSTEHDLAKYYGSYSKIKRAFDTNNENKLFEGTFSETECLFVMYTNAKYDFKNELFETEYTTKLEELIGTSPSGSYLQPTYGTKDVEILSKIILEEQIIALAELFAKFLDKEVLMIDELVICYHYILAQKVFNIPESIDGKGHRIATFRKDFFDTNDHFVLIFKNKLYKQVLLRRKIDKPQILNLLEKFSSTPTEVEVLSELIGTVITYKNGKFEFIMKVFEDLKIQLNNVSVPQSTVDEAIDRAARTILENSKFLVPNSFGNKDLSIRGDKAKVERRLDLLAKNIIGLINDAESNTIITIEESLGDGLLKVNGGLAGAVGNVFVADENSKLMKFADNIESLKGDLAKRLYLKLQKEIDNLQDYKINVKVKKFTKLSFDSGEHEENLVRDFLRRLIFFTNQSNEKEIGEILKGEMGEYPYNGIHLFQVKSEAIFLKYHDAIQEWWMKPDAAEYLTKHSTHFEDSSKEIINRPLISVVNMIHKLKMQKFKYTFNAAAVMAFRRLLDEQCKTNVNNIVTDNCLFTVAKLTESLGNKKIVVLDLEFVSNLLPREFKTLCTELAENKEIVILVSYGNWCKRFDDIVKAVKARLFIITKEKPSKISSNVYHFANDLINFSDESQQNFLKETKVIFQGEEVSLSFLVNDKNVMKQIKGDIFSKMLENKIIKIGNPIKTQNYDEELYIDRRISRVRKTEEDAFHEVKDNLVQSLYDLQEDVILVTAVPGMGKSSLLTHLSIQTKVFHPDTWIVRINLLEYSNIFSIWRKNKIVVDPMRSLHFICYAALGVEDVVFQLQAKDSVASLKYCSGDATLIFNLEMFLNFFNSGKLLFIFDGFDEIFPHYANKALSLLKSVRSFPRKHKIWITSRSYNDIKNILEQEFGRSYEIEPLRDFEQETYIRKFWAKHGGLVGEAFMDNEVYFYVPCHHPIYERKITSVNMPSEEPVYQSIYTVHFTRSIELYSVPTTSKNKQEDINYNHVKYTDDFFETPLHLNLLAEILSFYKYGVTRNPRNSSAVSDWRIEVSLFEIYKHYIEAKLNKIRFIQKNRVNMCNPDNILMCDRERTHILLKHKKLGAYAIFYENIDLIFNDNESKDVKKTINMLKLGTYKSDFIRGVAGNIPLFMHRLIAEYFAAGYISDLLHSNIAGDRRKLIIELSENSEVSEMLGRPLTAGSDDDSESSDESYVDQQ